MLAWRVVILRMHITGMVQTSCTALLIWNCRLRSAAIKLVLTGET